MKKIEWKWKALYLFGVVPLFLLLFAGSGSHSGGDIEDLLIPFLFAAGAVFVISVPLLLGLLFFRRSGYLKFAMVFPLVVVVVFFIFMWFRY